jgi:hypothetical protein
MVFFEEGFVLHPLRNSTEIATLPLVLAFSNEVHPVVKYIASPVVRNNTW